MQTATHSADPARKEVVIGIDLGTSGLRVAAVASDGEVIHAVQDTVSARRCQGEHEQNPVEWWQTLCGSLKELTSTVSADRIRALSVTSTSGTLVAVDHAGNPVRPAILYDDLRASAVLDQLRSLDAEGSWNASHSLTKALWVREYEPDVWRRIRVLLHPADWLAGKLCGEFRVSDYSNALKLGFDVEHGRWSAIIPKSGLDSALLPCIKAPGEEISTTGAGARDAGLHAGIPVVCGGTDGLTSLIASGASRPGDANTTIGTTIVWKVLARTPAPAGSGLYSHHHPAGFWAPGAASNSGAGCLDFDGRDPEQWNSECESALPTDVLCYPLRGKGERFPVYSTEWTEFFHPASQDKRLVHAARLQGLAFVERWGYERIEQAGIAVGTKVYSTGSACASRTLNRIRATALGRTVVQTRQSTASFGAAVLAASAAWYGGDVARAIGSMVNAAETVEPDLSLTERYESLYGAFRQACQQRGQKA